MKTDINLNYIKLLGSVWIFMRNNRPSTVNLNPLVHKLNKAANKWNIQDKTEVCEYESGKGTFYLMWPHIRIGIKRISDVIKPLNPKSRSSIFQACTQLKGPFQPRCMTNVTTSILSLHLQQYARFSSLLCLYIATYKLFRNNMFIYRGRLLT